MIQIQGLGKKFNRQTVLNGLNLQISAGDRIALIGQNGAGKTTLIRLLLGQYHYSGQLSVGGYGPRHQRTEVLSQIGFVPQHPPPLPMTVSELIQFTTRICGVSQQSIETVSDDLGLDIKQHAHKAFPKLSGGMKQKLLIALALARNPALLIMDEPAANLDPAGRKAFFQRLALSPTATSMILSSHRVDELLSLVNRVIEMDCGQIVQDEKINSLNIFS